MVASVVVQVKVFKQAEETEKGKESVLHKSELLKALAVKLPLTQVLPVEKVAVLPLIEVLIAAEPIAKISYLLIVAPVPAVK